MGIGNDPDSSNMRGDHEGLFGYYVRIEGKAAARGAAYRGLALWLQMVALELRETKLVASGGEGTYAKRLIGEGYDTCTHSILDS